MALGSAAAACLTLSGLLPSGRNGGALRRRDYRAGLGGEASVWPVRQPTRQYGGERDQVAATGPRKDSSRPLPDIRPGL
jgi:hypothetical protein